MTTAIRYFSKFGHSKMMAEAAGEVLGVVPESVAVPITGQVDTLYLGCGVMMGKIGGEMAAFIRSLKPEMVKRVICFGSCAIIKSPVTQMQSLLEKQGVTVDERSFTCRGAMGPLHAGHPDKQDLDDLRQFIKSIN